MKTGLFFFIFFLAFGLPAAPALARGTGDMFGDAVWVAGNRPRVASDWRKEGDMFQPLPLLLNGNVDLFGSMRPVRTSMREDMLTVRDRPFVYPARMFGPWKDR